MHGAKVKKLYTVRKHEITTVFTSNCRPLICSSQRNAACWHQDSEHNCT